MVDEALLKELKAKFDAGSDSAVPDDVLKVFEFLKQLGQENEDLKEELEDMDIIYK